MDAYLTQSSEIGHSRRFDFRCPIILNNKLLHSQVLLFACGLGAASDTSPDAPSLKRGGISLELAE